MPTFKELLAQKNELDKRIEEARIKEREEALSTVKQLVSTFGFTMQQAFPLPEKASKKAADRYHDPETGKSWNGLGKPPKWIEGKDRSTYEIKIAAEEPTRIPSAPTDPKNPFPVQ